MQLAMIHKLCKLPPCHVCAPTADHSSLLLHKLLCLTSSLVDLSTHISFRTQKAVRKKEEKKEEDDEEKEEEEEKKTKTVWYFATVCTKSKF